MYRLQPENDMDEEEEQCGMYDPNDDEEFDEVPTGELTQSQKEYIQELYSKFDTDSSGDLSFKELRNALQVLGLNPTVADVKGIMKEHNIGTRSKGGKKVTYEVFEQIMKDKILKQTTEFDILGALRLFDHNKDDMLDRDELKKCLTGMGEILTDDEVDNVFNTLDTDGNGKLSIIEVSKILAS